MLLNKLWRFKINGLNEKIDDIGKTIQKSSGLEQDTLNKEISKLRQEIAGSEARKEHFENQILELDRRKQSLQESIKISIQEIEEMKKEKGKNLKQDIDKPDFGRG